MPQKDKETTIQEPITRLHIPDEMIVNPDFVPPPTTKRKHVDPLQMLTLFSVFSCVMGALFMAQAEPMFYKMPYTLFGGVPRGSVVNKDMIHAAFFFFLGSLVLCIAGLLVYLQVKRKFGPGAVYYALCGLASVVLSFLLFRYW